MRIKNKNKGLLVLPQKGSADHIAQQPNSYEGESLLHLLNSILGEIKLSCLDQSVVASIACDPNVWNAVLQNTELQDFLHTHNTDVVLPEDMESNVNDWSPKTSESKSEPGKGIMDYVEDIKQKISVTVVEMVNSLSDTFQNLFGGSPKDVFNVNPDGAAEISVEKTVIGASLMGLAIMVIGLVLLKRPVAA